MSKRESTLKEVESNTRELRELLDQQKISGTSLDLSDDVKVCAPSQKRTLCLCRRLLANSPYWLIFSQFLNKNSASIFKIKYKSGRIQIKQSEKSRIKSKYPRSPRRVFCCRLCTSAVTG